MAIAQEDSFPITDILRRTHPPNCQWALFLRRDHDELTLEIGHRRRARLSVGQPMPMIRAPASYVGIRRPPRAADGQRPAQDRVDEFVAIVVFRARRSSIYGDEIGMGDNMLSGDRNGVRTMQWTPDRNGRFSRADPARGLRADVMDPVYGYEAVNVEAQSRSLSSLLTPPAPCASRRWRSAAAA